VSATSILSTRALRWDVGGATIVADVSLDVPEGECLGIIGPNGAGKTSLFNLLSGLIRPTGGEVVLAGREITDDPPYRRTQAGLGRTFQVSSVFPLLTVLENARLAAEAAAGGTMRIWRRAPRLEVADSALARVGLAGRARALAGSLSHGDKRKLEVAILLALEPAIMMFDEPTAGMSVDEVPVVLDLIHQVKAERNKTILLVEHKMDVVRSLADRIIVLHNGTLVADGNPADVMASAIVQEAYLGTPEHV
jgi:branched-chain amino acid transport system ATP-binding protein